MSAPRARVDANIIAPGEAALALASAKAGVEHKLPLADSIVYATAQAVGGVVWTQDEDFDGLPGVEYYPKPAGKS